MRLPTVAVVGHKRLTPLIQRLTPEYRGKAHIQIYEDLFEHALALSARLIAQQSADVILSAGANGTYLQENTSFPIALIRVTGYDLMRALVRAREYDDRIGLVAYRQTMPELAEVKHIFRFDVAQRSYETTGQATAAIRELGSLGYKVIVGSSITVEIAQQEGLIGVLVYSEDSARQGLNEAIELGRVASREEVKRERLSSLIHNLREGLLAIDFGGRIQAVNPALERLTGIARNDLLQRGVLALGADFQLQMGSPGDVSQSEAVVDILGRTVVVSRSPLYENGRHAGSVFTLLESSLVQQSERRLRSVKRNRAFQPPVQFAELERHSPSLKETIELSKRYAQTDATVLLTGESGTGKEWFAQSMHNHSRRRNNPFVAINCAAFPEALLESEFFGYEEGAFTGSRKGGKPGLIELAHTGTLFLDEIGDMPKSLQTRLLRVLQEREVQRLGASDATSVDIRVIAATLQPLEEMVQQGLFREDLFYRLNVLRIDLPPLRARPADIGSLAHYFLSKAGGQASASRDTASLLASLLPHLQRYHWPGNIRELDNIVQRFAVVASTLPAQTCIDERWVLQVAPEMGRAPINAADPDYAAIVAQYGSVAAAAKMLKISRTTLWRRMTKGQSLE